MILQFPKDTNLDFVVPIASVIYAATAGAQTTTVSEAKPSRCPVISSIDLMCR